MTESYTTHELSNHPIYAKIEIMERMCLQTMPCQRHVIIHNKNGSIERTNLLCPLIYKILKYDYPDNQLGHYLQFRQSRPDLY